MLKTRIVQVLLVVFIALTFVTSYISLTTYAPQNSTKTTRVPAQLYYAVGYENTTQSSYGTIMTISASCGNSTAKGNLINNVSYFTSDLESNNIVANFYTSGQSLTVNPGSENALGVYETISNKFASSSNCLVYNSTVLIALPRTLSMKVGSQGVTVTIPQNMTQQSLPITFTNNVSTTMKVKITALISQNATIYQNIQVTRA